MLNCTIYALISTITLGFACFDSVYKFSLCEPSYVNRMKIVRPCGSKTIANEAQRHPIPSNCGQNHSVEDPKEAARTMVCPWWMPRSLVEA